MFTEERGMNKCVKIVIKAQGADLLRIREISERASREYLIEGTLYLYTPYSAELIIAGSKERVDSFIDAIYGAVHDASRCDIVIEPGSKERDYRGVLRVIMFTTQDTVSLERSLLQEETN
jgi:hypothetical protein